ncbi:hypothetical protein BGZ52_001612 [Haplosporangium bisporale]|nr:hypothetical protein BGZ52_001612 [Haplosporangium bisporale]
MRIEYEDVLDNWQVLLASPVLGSQDGEDVENEQFLLRVSHAPRIDGSFNSEDISARQGTLGDRALIRPDGSIDFKDIFDPKVASLVLECLKSHFKAITKLLLDLFWERLGEAKEF